MNRRQFIGGSLAAGTAAAASAAGGKLLAGASLSNITPALGCSIAGGFTYEIATEIHDELHARALVMDNGQTRLALVTCDLCMLPREPIDRAKTLIERQCGISGKNILISAIHTHSGPAAANTFQNLPDPKYADWLVLRIADGVRRAVNHLEPARVGWGVGREGSLVFNRRYIMKPGTAGTDPFGRSTDTVKMNPGNGNPDVIRPAGPVDPEVSVLAVESLERRPICVLASYALHYVGGVPKGHISADYFAAWPNAIAALKGTPAGQTAYPPFVPFWPTRARETSITSTSCTGRRHAIALTRKCKRSRTFWRPSPIGPGAPWSSRIR